MTAFGVTPQGFVLKRLADILEDYRTALSSVRDPTTGEYLTPNLADENDPLVQVVNATADQLSVAWEQLEICYNQFDPLKATGAGLSTLVQLNAMLRRAGELDAALRIRQQAQTALPSYRQIDAIYAGVVQVPGVTFARVYQNRTLVTDSRGLPGKSVAVVAVGGTDQAVADAIFQKQPVGMDYHGNTTVSCQEGTTGFSYDVTFERPTEVPITMEIAVRVLDDGDWPSDGPDQIAAAVVAYGQYGLSPAVGLPPGADVIGSRLYTPINTVSGHEIVSIKMARDGGAPTLVDKITIAWNEVAQLNAGNITVTSA